MPSLDDLSVQAGLVFEGEVQQLGASTAAGFPASSETVIVRVTRVFKSPEALARSSGRQITVVLQPPVTLNVGQSAVFFTQGLHYGEGLVVRELGNVPPEPAMESRVNAALQAGKDRALEQRLAQAELVISGVASEPRPFVEARTGPRPISEHDPGWWVATINIETVEKGPHAGATKDVLFAHSIDIAWYRSPKINKGDRGVWLLHRRDESGREFPGHAVVDPLDFQPVEQRERVRVLLRSGE
jgi:hypothetical protein